MNGSKFAASDPSSAGGPQSWPVRLRVWMLVWNYVPLLHLVACGWAVLAVPPGWGVGVLGGMVYLLPPLLARVLMAAHPLVPGSHAVGSPVFLAWWATAQLQMLFCRVPVLEEALRLVPGLYSLWLRLWGARIGRFTFWAPGLRILDRSLLRVGDDVVFGAGVRINPHVIDTVDGRQVLHLAAVEIGPRARIGGYALLTAGCCIPADAALKAFTLAPPFTTWHEGKRVRPAAPGSPTSHL